MTRADYKKAIKSANKVLAENYVSVAPVDIKEIAVNYGLEVKEINFGEEYKPVAGYIDPEKKVIYVNQNDSERRKVFTIAHELGHWILHRDKLESDPSKYAILYRIPLGQLDDDPIESEANCFAANVLVPKDLLEKYKNKDPNEIAKIFGVSKEMIGYRLKDLYGHAPGS